MVRGSTKRCEIPPDSPSFIRKKSTRSPGSQLVTQVQGRADNWIGEAEVGRSARKRKGEKKSEEEGQAVEAEEEERDETEGRARARRERPSEQGGHRPGARQCADGLSLLPLTPGGGGF